MNKKYISPEFEILRVEIIEEVLAGSIEQIGTQEDTGGFNPNPGEEPTYDEEIAW